MSVCREYFREGKTPSFTEVFQGYCNVSRSNTSNSPSIHALTPLQRWEKLLLKFQQSLHRLRSVISEEASFLLQNVLHSTKADR